MKKFTSLLAILLLTVSFTGCLATRSEYIDELTPTEEAALELGARKLALQGQAVPNHLLSLFMESKPSRRIVYDSNKSGKATFRWELYDMPKNPNRITQKDINPHWVMVSATGDLRDPEWKLSFARENPALQTTPAAPAAPQQNNNRAPQRQQRPRQRRGSF